MSRYKEYKDQISGYFDFGFTDSLSQDYGASYYVYFLIDPRDDTIFYVGKGKGARATHHVREHNQGKFSNTDKHEIISEILENGQEPLIHVFKNNLSNSQALDLEGDIINDYKNDLTNGQSGIISQQRKDRLWAKKFLKSMTPFEIWVNEVPRPKQHISMYQETKAFLENIISGRENIVRGLRIETVNGKPKATYL